MLSKRDKVIVNNFRNLENIHMFFFTHGKIVGGGDEQKRRLADHTEDFVEWANRPEVNVHAVFVGHSHENNISRDVVVSESIQWPNWKVCWIIKVNNFTIARD